jgi:hypothetical protein
MTREDCLLKGRVHVGEKVRGAHGRREIGENCWITQTSLVSTLRVMTSPASVIAPMPVEQKIQFVVDLLSALCHLATRKDGTFRTRLQQAGFTKSAMLELFRRVRRYQWYIREGRENRHYTPAMSVERFNTRLAATFTAG